MTEQSGAKSSCRQLTSDEILVVFLKTRLLRRRRTSENQRVGFQRDLHLVLNQFLPRIGERRYARCEPFANYIMRVEDNWSRDPSTRRIIDNFAQEQLCITSYRDRRLKFKEHLKSWICSRGASEAHLFMVFMHIHALAEYYYEQKNARKIGELIYMAYDLLEELDFPDRWEEFGDDVLEYSIPLSIPESHKACKLGCNPQTYVFLGTVLTVAAVAVAVPLILAADGKTSV